VIELKMHVVERGREKKKEKRRGEERSSGLAKGRDFARLRPLLRSARPRRAKKRLQWPRRLALLTSRLMRRRRRPTRPFRSLMERKHLRQPGCKDNVHQGGRRGLSHNSRAYKGLKRRNRGQLGLSHNVNLKELKGRHQKPLRLQKGRHQKPLRLRAARHHRPFMLLLLPMMNLVGATRQSQLASQVCQMMGHGGVSLTRYPGRPSTQPLLARSIM
jgi:hypothetical protein